MKSLFAGAFIVAIILAFGWAAALGVVATPQKQVSAGTGVVTTVFTIEGMSCGSCVERVTVAISKLDGILDKQVAVGSAVVKYDSSKVSRGEIAAAIERIGYTVSGTEDQLSPAPTTPQPLAQRSGGCGCGG